MLAGQALPGCSEQAARDTRTDQPALTAARVQPEVGGSLVSGLRKCTCVANAQTSMLPPRWAGSELQVPPHPCSTAQPRSAASPAAALHPPPSGSWDVGGCVHLPVWTTWRTRVPILSCAPGPAQSSQVGQSSLLLGCPIHIMSQPELASGGPCPQKDMAGVQS